MLSKELKTDLRLLAYGGEFDLGSLMDGCDEAGSLSP